MAKRWRGRSKLVEECAELIVELAKLEVFPHGKHPGRKRNLKISTEEEISDVYAALDYFVAMNGFDREKIKKRRLLKVKKFVKWWGSPDAKSIRVKPRAIKPKPTKVA